MPYALLSAENRGDIFVNSEKKIFWFSFLSMWRRKEG